MVNPCIKTNETTCHFDAGILLPPAFLSLFQNRVENFLFARHVLPVFG